MKGKRIGNSGFLQIKVEKRDPVPWPHPAVFRKSAEVYE
jgi:hypothetical protein